MSDLRIGLIGGSGLGDALAGQGESARRHDLDTPFGRPSDAIIETIWDDVTVFLLSRHGPGHLLNPSRVPYRANIYALKALGCTHVLATGAVGSLREEYRPTDLVIVDQVIDRTHRRDGTFFENAAVHVEFAEPFDPVLRRIVLDAAGQGNVAKLVPRTDGQPIDAPAPAGLDVPKPPATVHDRGCYVAMEGPAFSTRAESLMHRLWGGDLIGMTAMPEAKLAREAEMGYALIALVTDYDCWRQKPVTDPAVDAPDASVLLKEIIGNLKTAGDNALTLVRQTIALMSQRQSELATSTALRALELGIWSDRTRIPPQEIERLRPLWGKYFGKSEPPVMPGSAAEDDRHRSASRTGTETPDEPT